jgi:hypothetical protein
MSLNEEQKQTMPPLDAAFRTLRATTATTAPQLAPGLLWWRAQLRRRNEALRQIEQPLLAAELLALVLVLGSSVGLVVVAARSGAPWLLAAQRSIVAPWVALFQTPWTMPLAAAALLTLLGAAIALLACDKTE